MRNVADGKKEKLQLVDLAGIGNLLEHFVAEDAISCDERDRIIQKIARDHGLAEHTFPILAGYGRSKSEVLESTTLQCHRSDESYIFLPDIAREHSDDAPGYVIQSWLRSGNTLAFLNLWEKRTIPITVRALTENSLEKKQAASFTLTPKLWVSQTNAIGIVSKQGKSGGTLAHPLIACEFASWLTPEFKMLLLRLSLGRVSLS